MKTLGVMLGIGLIVLAIAGANTGADWSAQATTRAELGANADIKIALHEAEAAMHAADRQAEAQMHAAEEATRRTALWTGVLPIVAVIVLAGAVLVVVVWFRGRAHVLRVQAMLDGGQPVALLPQPPPQVLMLAQERGARPALVDGQWHLLIDGQVVARVRQLPGPAARR